MDVGTKYGERALNTSRWAADMKIHLIRIELKIFKSNSTLDEIYGQNKQSINQVEVQENGSKPVLRLDFNSSGTLTNFISISHWFLESDYHITRNQRIAHGSITAGFFSLFVRHSIDCALQGKTTSQPGYICVYSVRLQREKLFIFHSYEQSNLQLIVNPSYIFERLYFKEGEHRGPRNIREMAPFTGKRFDSNWDIGRRIRRNGIDQPFQAKHRRSGQEVVIKYCSANLHVLCTEKMAYENMRSDVCNYKLFARLHDTSSKHDWIISHLARTRPKVRTPRAKLYILFQQG